MIDQAMTKFTDKQAAFVREYLVDLNGSAAARRAGYSEKIAGNMAIRLLQETPHVKAAIDEAMAKRAEKVNISAEWVVTNLVELAQRCMQKVPVLDDDGKPTGEWKFEPNAANKSLELLGKHLGIFEKDNKRSLEVAGPGGGPVQIQDPVEAAKLWQTMVTK